MKYTECDTETYQRWFNERDYNKPDDYLSNEFGEEFDGVIDALRDVLQKNDLSWYDYDEDTGDYAIYEQVVDGRFIDVSFENERHEDPKLIADVQSLVMAQKEDWMICMHFLKTYFVTKADVLWYD
ncbi:hypothetical protein [Rubritalea squalenifaciens]|uniref:hypothetical protein n=1 Tax=Rubritalea squalenifaciens TaxID=407226 RepID=UPI001160C29A|nr:hypothetical protein [Rubritalea squalenifaciens]